MRILVIGDIHGGLKALKQLIERAKITPKDQLIFLGDYVDGWSDSAKLIDFLIELKQTHQCIFMRGNHDELLCAWLDQGRDNPMWLNHGGASTVAAYQKLDQETKKQHILFLKSLENYYLDHKNRLFIHAGFTNLKGVDFEYFPKMFYWERTLWESALALDPTLSKTDTSYPKRFLIYDEIYIGHTPVTQIDQTSPQKRACVWNIDTGAAFLGPLTALDVDTKEFWQSDSVASLYTNEKGRN